MMTTTVNGEYFFDQKVYLTVSKRKWKESPIHFCIGVTVPSGSIDIKGWEIDLLQDVFYVGGEGSVKHIFDKEEGLTVRLCNFKRIFSTSK